MGYCTLYFQTWNGCIFIKKYYQLDYRQMYHCFPLLPRNAVIVKVKNNVWHLSVLLGMLASILCAFFQACFDLLSESIPVKCMKILISNCFEGTQMGHHLTVAIWYASLLSYTRFCFLYITSRKIAFELLRETIKL